VEGVREMKIGGLNMKHIKIIFAAFIFLIAGCSGGDKPPSDAVQPGEIKEAELTLELTLGGANDKNTGEFLLAVPQYLDVSYNGDIFIMDENIIKVFDDNGEPKTIVGGIGQGPGEYSERSYFFLAPNGSIAVLETGGWSSARRSSYSYLLETGLNSYYSIFTSGYSFIEKKRLAKYSGLIEFLNEQGFNVELTSSTGHISKVYALKESELLFEFALIKENEPDPSVKGYKVVVYENKGSYSIVLMKKIVTPPKFNEEISQIVMGICSEILGKLFWELLPDGNIVYVNTMEDEVNEQGDSFYTINVIELSGRAIKQIKHKFNLVNLPEDYFEERSRDLPSGLPASFKKQLEDSEKNKVMLAKAKKYYASIMTMKVDGRYIFLFPYEERNNSEEPSERLKDRRVDVFNLDAGTYVTSVTFPFIPYVIRNGYAYERHRGEDQFTVINKYKIDPAVYGK